MLILSKSLSISVLWGKFFKVSNSQGVGKSPGFLGTLTNSRSPDLFWLRPLYRAYYLYFTSHKNHDAGLGHLTGFHKKPSHLKLFCDFVKFPECAWCHGEESPCLFHNIPPNMASVPILRSPFSISLSSCPTLITHSFLFLSLFPSQKASNHLTPIPCGEVFTLHRLLKVFFTRKVSFPQKELVYHLLYSIFFYLIIMW